MSKPFKFRRARLLAGVFLALCIGLVALGLLKTEGLAELFPWEPPRKVWVKCGLPRTAAQAQASAAPQTAASIQTPDRVLVRGARVELAGQTIGVVEKVLLQTQDGAPGDPKMDGGIDLTDYRIMGELKLHGDFARLVRPDSKVFLREDLGGFGGVYLDILPGREAMTGDVLLDVEYAGSARTDMESVIKTLGMVGDKLSGLQDDIKPLLQKDGQMRKSVAEVVEELKNLTKQAGELMVSANDATASFQSDSKLMTHMNSMAENLSKMSKALSDGKIESHFPSITRTLDSISQELARAVDSFNASARAVTEASQSLKDTSRAAQESFLLRGGTKRVEAEKKTAAAKAAAEQAKSKAAGQPASPPSKSEGLFKRLFGPGDATAVPP